MGQTLISWTATPLYNQQGELIRWLPGYSFNPWIGCVRKSTGCIHCYAEGQTKRFTQKDEIVPWGPLAPRRQTSEGYWLAPHRWNRDATQKGVFYKVFCASMADVFEKHQDASVNTQLDEDRFRLWNLIDETPHLIWLLLTKRPENILHMLPLSWITHVGSFPQNVWVGTSVENQRYAEERIPFLLQVPASVHFLSCEPLLGEEDLTEWLPSLQWVITGAESGPNARPMHIEWVRSLRDQCVAYHVPFYFKQAIIEGKKVEHPSLDGEIWRQFPPQGVLCDVSL